MTSQQQSSKVLDRILWIVQLILAVSLLWAAAMKWFQPIDKLSAMWPWVGQVPSALVKFTGLVDFLGAFGLVLPAWLRIKPQLTPLAAVGIIALMIIASIFHSLRGEASVIGVNIVFALMAAFVAWGRFRKVPISSK
ncbi:DoxX family protein [Spirosoma koreense]